MNLSQTVGTLTLLGDESRVRLCALLREQELTVSELVRVTGLAQSRVSSHLARLRDGGFVKDRRDGPHAFYVLSDGGLSPAARAVLDEVLAAADPQLAADRERLSALLDERRGALPSGFAGEMERHYSPGRTWASLAFGMSALLDLGEVLDVGSGDGSVAALIAPRAAKVTCVDASARMVEAARARLAAFPHVSAHLADATTLPFGEGTFDTVLLFHTLAYAERPAAVVAECARVLRPGGRLVVLSLEAHDRSDVTSAFGERHPGFSTSALGRMLAKPGLSVKSCAVVTREAKKPHFSVVLGLAEKPGRAPHKPDKKKKSP
jgi:ArsR family transcriptional regulator